MTKHDKESLRIVFRTDASIQIGTGHVMRCLTLADELTRQGHVCRFICREHEGHLGDLIANKGYNLTLLPEPSGNELAARYGNSDDYALWLGVPWQEDARQTLDAITTWSPDWLVVDHYALDAEWERTLSSTMCKIMVIDDLANRTHECAILLDQNLGREVSDYDELLPVNCQRLVGPRYALLRPEFSELREQSLSRRQHPEFKRILISLGGVDRTNVTGQVLKALEGLALPPNIELDIIMGAAAPYLDEVRQQADRLPFKASVSVNVENMAERMCLADLSIGAAGGTSWERCCLGLPAVLVVLAKNQVEVAEALRASSAALTINNAEKVNATLTLAVLALCDSCLLKQMSEAAASITNGSGAISAVRVMSKTDASA